MQSSTAITKIKPSSTTLALPSKMSSWNNDADKEGHNLRLNLATHSKNTKSSIIDPRNLDYLYLSHNQYHPFVFIFHLLWSTPKTTNKPLDRITTPSTTPSPSKTSKPSHRPYLSTSTDATCPVYLPTPRGSLLKITHRNELVPPTLQHQRKPKGKNVHPRNI